MRGLSIRLRYYALTIAAGGLYFLGGCGLSDQQLASIWQSVITTGLSTLVTSAVSAAVGGTQATT